MNSKDDEVPLVPESSGDDPIWSKDDTLKCGQKYDQQGRRLVACCIPVKFVDSNPKDDDVRVMLVSSRRGGGFLFPKGEEYPLEA